MNVQWLFFEIGINLFQGWMYTFFLKKLLTIDSHHSAKTVRLSTLGVISAVAGFYSLYIPFDLPISDTIVFGFTFLYSFFIFTDPWYIKLMWNIVTGVVLVAITTLISQLFIHVAGASWDVLMQPSLLRMGFVLCTNVVLFVIYYVITKVKSPLGKLSWYALALFILLNAVVLLALEMQYMLSWQPNILQTPVLITIFCMLFVSAGLLILFELLSYKSEKQAQMELEIETARLMENHFEETRGMYQRMMEYEHDMKHQINVLQQMIDQGNFQESSAYLQAFRRAALPIHYATGCVAVDALLSAKTVTMEQQKIEFEFTPYPLNEIPIDAPVLCAIIGNLLDNAIEAIGRVPYREKSYTIHLSFSRTRDMFFISCKNETDGMKIRRKGEDFLSSKRKNRIGCGIASIKHHVEMADGYTSFRVENGIFVAEIVLPFGKDYKNVHNNQ